MRSTKLQRIISIGMLTFVWDEGGLDFAEVIEDRHSFSMVYVSINCILKGSILSILISI
jgi:hypothetical protein